MKPKHVCYGCGHTAAQHGERRHCRAVVKSQWEGGREDSDHPEGAVWERYTGWVCGCKTKRKSIEPPKCSHCHGTGFEELV